MPARTYVHARAPPLAAAAAAGRPAMAPAPVPVPVPGSGLGLGSGSGSLPGLVLFESGLRVWIASRPAPLSGFEPTRQRTRSATVGLPTVVTVGCVSWTTNSCDCWVERLHPFVGFEPVGPSWNAINSAPDSQLKDTLTTTPKFRINSLSLSEF